MPTHINLKGLQKKHKTALMPSKQARKQKKKSSFQRWTQTNFALMAEIALFKHTMQHQKSIVKYLLAFYFKQYVLEVHTFIFNSLCLTNPLQTLFKNFCTFYTECPIFRSFMAR